MEAVMERVGLEAGVMVKVRQALSIPVLALAAVAAFASPAQGAVSPGESEGKVASGTVGVTSRVILLSYRDERDLVEERLVHRQLTGSFAGTEVSVVHYVIHQDGSATITAATTCSCTVEGRTGTVTFIEKGTVSAALVISADRESIDSTGGLAGLSAELHIAGPVMAPTQTYTGHYAFDGED
jgi:hypothetical protein